MIKEMGAKRERVGEKWSGEGSTFFFHIIPSLYCHIPARMFWV